MIMDGRDVAIATPERNGDGSWTSSVITCGEPEAGPAPIDGVLDCTGGLEWIEQSDGEGSVPGSPIPEDAVRAVLEPYQQSFGGEIVMIDQTTGSLVAAEREQVVARATEVVPAGGWVVDSGASCSLNSHGWVAEHPMTVLTYR